RVVRGAGRALRRLLVPGLRPHPSQWTRPPRLTPLPPRQDWFAQARMPTARPRPLGRTPRTTWGGTAFSLTIHLMEDLVMRAVFAVAFLIIGSSMADPAAGREEPQPGHLVFRCRLVINPSEGKAIPDAIIEAAGGKILDVGGADEVPIAPGAKVIDFSD